MVPRSCVGKDGCFIVGIHDPGFKVANLRENDHLCPLGALPDGTPVENRANFPKGDVEEPHADRIYEIANPFSFRGVTYVNSRWADRTADAPESILLPGAEEVSFLSTLEGWFLKNGIEGKHPGDLVRLLPRPMRMALADTSTDPGELVALAKGCCSFIFEEGKTTPTGLAFKGDTPDKAIPEIHDHTLFEIIANNPFLPDTYKRAMVLTPGVQGTSEIVGEWQAEDSHVFEYLRTNSYIPWGHFAANTADDTVRYKIRDLTLADMKGMRHLCYQRIYAMTAQQLGIPLPGQRQTLSEQALENLRLAVRRRLDEGDCDLRFNGSLWGWNFGFGFAQSGYRLHASHQQIHQQYAMVPAAVTAENGRPVASYACGDLVADFAKQYRQETDKGFFDNYLAAIRSNTRTDGHPDRASSLVVHEDDNTILFVPKAQTSQWELQLMAKRPCGNILEADTAMRDSLDRGILMALTALEALGARMVTNIEYSKRFDSKDTDQRLLYSFLPRLPHSPGAFSEAQLRWITGHYPEDFALACRSRLAAALS
ncbi:MAG: hypothetical protein GY737_23595 [Desulfobacteraceae bacterium]|nr:hypothetical protein [Desulfobacteraceae bacterium]